MRGIGEEWEGKEQERRAGGEERSDVEKDEEKKKEKKGRTRNRTGEKEKRKDGKRWKDSERENMLDVRIN